MDLLLSRLIIIKSFLLFRSTGSILWLFWRASIIEERLNRKRTLLNNHKKKMIKIKKIIKKEKHKYRKIKIPTGEYRFSWDCRFLAITLQTLLHAVRLHQVKKNSDCIVVPAQDQQEVICNWPHPIPRDKTTHCRQTQGKLKLQDVIRSDNR